MCVALLVYRPPCFFLFFRLSETNKEHTKVFCLKENIYTYTPLVPCTVNALFYANKDYSFIKIRLIKPIFFYYTHYYLKIKESDFSYM